MIKMVLFCVGFFTAAMVVIIVPRQWWGNIHNMSYLKTAVLLVMASFVCHRAYRDLAELIHSIKVLYRARRRYHGRRTARLLPL